MKKFNLNELIWFLVLLTLSLYIFFMIYTGKIYILIHPKMKVYLIIGFIILFIFTIMQFPKIFTIPDRGGLKKNNLIFIFAVAMLMIAGNINVSSTYLEFKGVNLFPYYDDHEVKEKHNHETSIPSGIIELKDENFYCYLEDIQKNIDDYIGREVQVEGMVYAKKNMNNNSFIVTRLVMNCCAADSQYIGVTCTYYGGNVKTNTWVNIKGTVTKNTIKDSKGRDRVVPEVKVNSIEKIKEPNNLFIYQN
ncbi:putative membrane protein [Clostridium cavendishii DSM 21758]|uniref:Putative membrane protein n=1 Tax=Clostridium cavendishii DSM 21758 TaxID=1121302 RepID=A0A1M6SWA1_9CLOT|nr:TIGR03943 family protein [Clostridium cavendishii]SHK48920.1 putative membrane protein [Clostridium cavendishii DSM 21758]